ncbi:histone acetyltransferase MCC1 isoform X2 [Helianthus annuus]|uniref:histone acetyltransferase MCC1 isoform X2 n=1 Tax=Helianthus annuus TaxID=4232 RepID=UPI000B90590E|nr:histone acetyltransferase MCC1 isoform X2 [Helianthus annuus]XP_035841464.1 histone acetyltransferase MCC1 isoform X2 [Helianthus annuus]
MSLYPMMNLRASRHPSISYRPIRPSDLEVLVKIHGDLFPIRYELEFFHSVVHGRDIVSWGAVDRNSPNGENDELIGFVTARIVMAKETTSLIREVIKYASDMPNCRAIYLHVISYNNSAIHLYQKMSFLCVRRLHAFYYIDGQHYDAYLFSYYVNGGRSPCSPLELVTLIMTYMRKGLKLVFSRVSKNTEKNGPKRVKYRDKSCLLPMTQSKRSITIEGPESDHV